MRYRARSISYPVGLVAVGCVLSLGAACQGPGLLKVEDATLPVLAIGHDEIPAEAASAPQLVVMPGQPVTIPNVPMVKLAVDRAVPWAQVRAILDIMNARAQKPVFLIARRRKLKAFHLDDELAGPSIEVYAETDGKICVKHPEVREAKCSQTQDKSYIDPSFARELVREGVDGYQRTNVTVDLPDALAWGDVVSSIGGARSCCGDRDIRVMVATE